MSEGGEEGKGRGSGLVWLWVGEVGIDGGDDGVRHQRLPVQPTLQEAPQ